MIQAMDTDSLSLAPKLAQENLTVLYEGLQKDGVRISYRTLIRMKAGQTNGTVTQYHAVLEALKRGKSKRKEA